MYVPLTCVVLALLTFIAFEQVCRNDFINYDDNKYVTENPHVKTGITRESVIWAFTTPHAANWHPLTWISHMLDYELYGLNPAGHHFTNLLFHVANTLLLFFVLKCMTGNLWPSAFVAAVFALHPLHVESVAWAAERKDVLSGLFWMLTIAAYIRYAERACIRRFLLVVLALCLGLMAKSMLVTLPFVLLLLDYWPLGRLRLASQKETLSSDKSKPLKVGYPGLSAWRLVWEKFPLFILVTVSSVITYIVQQKGGTVTPIDSLSLGFRITNALISYLHYLYKLFYPAHLAVLYPIGTLSIWEGMAAGFLLLFISHRVIHSSRNCKYIAVGWLWYLGTLVPVIGFVQVGAQAMADRYTYLPSIGIFIMAAWGVGDLFTNRLAFAHWRYGKIAIGILAGLLLFILLIRTQVQVRYWRNSLTLYEHTLETTENNFIIHCNYAYALKEEKGRLDEAIKHFKKAIQINPRCLQAYQGIAWVLATAEDEKLRNPTEAIRLAEQACELTNYQQPGLLDTLGVAYAAAGRFQEAVAAAEKAINIYKTAGKKELAEQIQERLQSYKKGQPHHEK
jgi:tetratricopeptide (TPR) repeat protein